MTLDTFALALLQKAWLVVESCQTPEHARSAMRWLDLVERADPEINTQPLRQELQTLFDPQYFG